MPPIRREIVFDESAAWNCALADLDLPALRAGFAGLMERAAAAVQARGYEQDDSLVERLLVCRVAAGEVVTVDAAWLADAERLAAHVRARVGELVGRGVGGAEVSIAGLRVTATLEGWPGG